MVRASSCREERMISIEGGYQYVEMKDLKFLLSAGESGQSGGEDIAGDTIELISKTNYPILISQRSFGAFQNISNLRTHLRVKQDI